jgi:hypothetical protein
MAQSWPSYPHAPRLMPASHHYACLTVRGYAGLMLPLGFRFDVDAVLLGAVAHRPDCRLLPAPRLAVALTLTPGEVYSSERCPRECPLCRPSFETLLSFQRERLAAGLVS